MEPESGRGRRRAKRIAVLGKRKDLLQNMKRIQPSVELIREADPFRNIEQIGRTCYMSSSDMTDETARKFYRVLASRSHTAMLEHAWFVFQVSDAVYQECISKKFLNKTSVEGRNLVSGNLRGLNECGVAALLNKLKEFSSIKVSSHSQMKLFMQDLLISQTSNMLKVNYLALSSA